MSQPYVGEIRMFGGNFAPAGWQFCEGQLLPISEFETLFNLIGTTYGGDGQSTFALPDLRGRLPVHAGAGYVLAQSSGVETVTLTTQQLPSHGHTPIAIVPAAAPPAINATNPTPSANLPALGASRVYGTTAPTALLNAVSVVGDGGSQPHDNMMPYLCVNFIISLFGVFPSQT